MEVINAFSLLTTTEERIRGEFIIISTIVIPIRDKSNLRATMEDVSMMAMSDHSAIRMTSEAAMVGVYYGSLR
jgi:hypothetical protein